MIAKLAWFSARATCAPPVDAGKGRLSFWRETCYNDTITLSGTRERAKQKEKL